MLRHHTAYPITASNAELLSILSGRPLKELKANVGWCATYSETRYPRWMIVPEIVAKYDMGMPIDRETYP